MGEELGDVDEVEEVVDVASAARKGRPAVGNAGTKEECGASALLEVERGEGAGAGAGNVNVEEEYTEAALMGG